MTNKINTKKDTKKINNMVVKFVQITRDFAPQFVETKYNDTILFGEDNQLPYLLTDLYGSVSLHKGIIEKKQNMIKANGLYIDDGDTNFNKTVDFFESVNDSENFEDIWDKIVSDEIIYGGTYLQIVWSRDGKQINKISHMPFETMRSGKADENGIVQNYYYNADRTKTGKYKKYTKGPELVEFPAFGTPNKKEPQIYYIKSYNPQSFYYGLPDYSAAITDLDTFRSISEFHNANIHNGMQPSYVVMFKGPSPSQEKQDRIVESIKTKHKGIDNAGKPLLFFLDGDDEIKLETVEKSENDTMFETLYTNTQSNIITAHQIPRILANVATEGSLGSGKEYLEAEIIFNKSYIQPIQQFLLKKVNVLFNINDFAELKIQPVAADLSNYSLDDLLKLYTVEDLINLLGLPESTKNNTNENE